MSKLRLLIGLSGLVIFLAANTDLFVLGRDLACPALQNPRAEEICRITQKHLHFELTGHAMFAPGWKPSLDTVKAVYCEAHITAEDGPALKLLSTQSDWRISMVGQALTTTFDPDMNPRTVFDPRSPNYILKGGCSQAQGVKP